MSFRRAGRFLAAIGLFVTIGGCRSGTDPVAGSIVAVHDGAWSEDDGQLTGRLEVIGNCLFVTGPDGSRAVPIFAEDGLKWSADDAVLSIDGTAFGVGRQVSFGGGFWQAKSVHSAPDGARWVNAPHNECLDAPFFLVARP